MKFPRFAAILFLSSFAFVRAQDEERQGTPPVEIPDFSNLDEYIYEPKNTVMIGMRQLGGAKASFSGQGSITAPDDPGPATGANLVRTYRDGAVFPDTRTVQRVDANGNPIIDPQTGFTVFDPIAPDGRTNTWEYSDANQATENGYLAFHTYSAEIVDTGIRQKTGKSAYGVELAVSRDMGALFGTRAKWNLTAGMSVNDISANTSDSVLARITTLTDLFSLFGQTPPAPPYSAPTSATQTLLDANGNPVVIDGVTQTVTVDTTVLLGNEPASRTLTETTNMTSVTNRWKLKGAYYTFRAGPTVWIPITSRFRASISVGAALIYSGTNYMVTQVFQPEVGPEVFESEDSNDYKLLPGYYADATLQFDLTDKAGFYAGAIFQSAGDYSQEIDTPNAKYSTRVDFANQTGVRAGMSIRF